ncbi:hypothetical protein DKX38_026725 [Salix brachista]|uniref:Uncharacterized protein n=1 Tax=Salix brachista TaxID=2182728 RepID=A0A5N5JLZ2_9ROSI|nr:hypothetical protein DKX38_026725 [Salix brachista]
MVNLFVVSYLDEAAKLATDTRKIEGVDGIIACQTCQGRALVPLTDVIDAEYRKKNPRYSLCNGYVLTGYVNRLCQGEEGIDLGYTSRPKSF